MNDIAPIDADGVVGEVQVGLAIELQRAELDQQITTARAFPRNIGSLPGKITALVTLDEETAEECMYALPRGGKPIQGPSARFAEIVRQVYGNCRAAARVTHVDRKEGFVEAEGLFHDLETNSANTARVRRRILDKRGRLFSDDMIIVTGNAACSIAMRNAILAGVPKSFWRKGFDTARSVIAGDVQLLAVKREQSVKAFANYGASPEDVLRVLGKEALEDIVADDIVTMRGMLSALKNAEATVEEMFTNRQGVKSDHRQVENPLDDAKPSKDTSADVEALEQSIQSAATTDALTTAWDSVMVQSEKLSSGDIKRLSEAHDKRATELGD